MENNFVVIMAGGVGTRFWPFSRTHFPKQFHDVLGVGKTLIQQTVERFEGVCPKEHIYIVTSKDYEEITRQQLPFLKEEQVILEPLRRNTAPCIAYACYRIAQRNPNANILVAPADHVILKEEEFKKIARNTLHSASKKEVFVTLGIKPTRPDTGYGYIQYHQRRNLLSIFKNFSLKKVKTFVEKPVEELAQQFLESGDYVWNAGIFVWNVQTIIKAFEKYLPEMAEAFSDIQATFYTPDEAAAIAKAYSLCKNISIDIGLMEKAAKDEQDNVYVVLCDLGWSDLGTWKSLYEIQAKDRNDNVMVGKIMHYNTTNCIIKMPSEKLVVVNGLDNFIVAEYEDVLLICDKNDEQRVKDFVNDAKKQYPDFT
ncbi:MAG: mannose-1-phosphate guanylyltransferase [Thermonemataceae bacterium]